MPKKPVPLVLLFVVLSLVGVLAYFKFMPKKTGSDVLGLISRNCKQDPLLAFLNENGDRSRLVYTGYLLENQGIDIGDPPGHDVADGIEFLGFDVPETECYAVWYSREDKPQGKVVYESNKGIVVASMNKVKVLEIIDSNKTPAYEPEI